MADEPDGTDGPDEPSGRQWSTPARLVLVLAVVLLTVAAFAHLGAIFLHVAPKNSLSREYDKQLDTYIYPELEQNWQLFAPNPLGRNVSVHARADLVTRDGRQTTTDWRNLTAQDIGAVRGNPLPSHTDQNVLRRAWDVYASSHDERRGERAFNERGRIIGDYLRRLVVQRMGPAAKGARILRVRVRARFELVPPASWDSVRQAESKTRPWFRTLPWWTVPDDEGADGAKGGRR